MSLALYKCFSEKTIVQFILFVYLCRKLSDFGGKEVQESKEAFLTICI